MLPASVLDKIQGNLSKPSFFKSLSPGETWKSESMRIIPEEFVSSTKGAVEHRAVFSVRWGNSWHLWLERDENGLFIIEEDWDIFVDDNLLGPENSLFFTHQYGMFIDVWIFNKDEEEVIDVPLEAPEPESEPLISETIHASTSASASRVTLRSKDGFVPVKNPERYLKNSKNPCIVKTLTKRNDVLYVAKTLISRCGLRFGQPNSPVTYLLPDGGKEEAFLRLYSGNYAISGWGGLCRRHNLNHGDSVVCEIESESGGLVTAVRLHFPNE